MRFRAITVVMAAAVAVWGCNPSQLSQQGGKRRLSIATGGTGGVYYPYGGGLAKILSENLENVEVTAEVTAASVDNLKFLRNGRSDIAFTMADTLDDAAHARAAFETFGAVPARALAVLYSNYTHLVTRADTGIARVADLHRRVISTGAAGSGTEVVAFRILEAAGLDRARDLRTQSLGVAQSVDALKDGKLDAFFWNGGLPTGAILDLAHTPGLTVKLLPTDDLLPALRQKYGHSLYQPLVIPRTTYNTDRDVGVVGIANLLVVSESMPEPLAYDVTRLLFDKQSVLASIHPQARDLSLTSAVTGSPVPFHAGAVRYYREKNVWHE